MIIKESRESRLITKFAGCRLSDQLKRNLLFCLEGYEQVIIRTFFILLVLLYSVIVVIGPVRADDPPRVGIKESCQELHPSFWQVFTRKNCIRKMIAEEEVKKRAADDARVEPTYMKNYRKQVKVCLANKFAEMNKPLIELRNAFRLSVTGSWIKTLHYDNALEFLQKNFSKFEWQEDNIKKNHKQKVIRTYTDHDDCDKALPWDERFYYSIIIFFDEDEYANTMKFFVHNPPTNLPNIAGRERTCLRGSTCTYRSDLLLVRLQ